MMTFDLFHAPAQDGLYALSINESPPLHFASRGAAQRVYKAEVQRRVDPALLEQVGPRPHLVPRKRKSAVSINCWSSGGSPKAARGRRRAASLTVTMRTGSGRHVLVVGEVLEIDPPNRLVMTFDMKPEGFTEAPSRVTYELADHESATKLTVIHDNFPPNTDVLHRISSGWPRILSGMKTYIESGKLG